MARFMLKPLTHHRVNPSSVDVAAVFQPSRLFQPLSTQGVMKNGISYLVEFADY